MTSNSPKWLLPVASIFAIWLVWLTWLLMGSEPTESEECTESDLLCHLIHSLYPVGIFDYTRE